MPPRFLRPLSKSKAPNGLQNVRQREISSRIRRELFVLRVGKKHRPHREDEFACENKPPDGKRVPGRSEQRPIFRRSSNSILFSRKSVVLLFIIDISIGILLVFLLLFFLSFFHLFRHLVVYPPRNGHAQNVEHVGCEIHHSPNR